MRLTIGGCVLSSLIACSEGPTTRALNVPERTEPALPPTDPALTAGSVDTPAATSTAPVEPVVPPTSLPTFDRELLKQVGPEGARKLEVVASVCAAAVFQGKDGKAYVGCRACPPFDKSTGPDGQVVLVTDSNAFYELEHLTFGSFTRPGADEVAATFAGCETYAGNYGGTILAERNGAVWVARSYRAGFHPNECLAYRLPDGRHKLLCTWETGKQTSSELLDFYDFAADLTDTTEESGAVEHIFSLYDNVALMCLGPPPGSSAIAADILSFKPVPAGDSPSKIELTVRFGSTKADAPAFNAACNAFYGAEDPIAAKIPDPRSVIKQQVHKLTLKWKGATLVLDAASEKRWMGLQPAEPDFAF